MSDPAPIRVTPDSLIVLAGPSGAGKSTWAHRWFENSQIVASDDLRGVVGHHVNDLRASADAFAVLDLVIERRLARGLVTVVDTLGMDAERHDHWVEMAQAHGRPTHLVVFSTDDKTCRKNNRSRPSPVPTSVLTAQLQKWTDLQDQLGAEFDQVHTDAPALIVPSALMPSALTPSGAVAPSKMNFGLQVSAFDWPGGNPELGQRLGEIAADAERAGFSSIWVMDHFIQIPQVGREWDPMLDSYTTLGYLAGRTSTIALGAMVTCVTYRHLAHLGKIIATLDVLSGGRARCGLGVGWFKREHDAYDIEFPPVGDRYDLLEDALELLPLLWGPGSPSFTGRTLTLDDTVCYPRPLQEKVPILIGGSGEKRTLKLVAQYADACNLFGEPDAVRHKVEVLHEHCAATGRSPDEIEVTQLSALLCAPSSDALKARLATIAPGMPAADATQRLMAGTPAEHIERFGRLAEAGVGTAMVSLADVGHPDAIGSFQPVIEALS